MAAKGTYFSEIVFPAEKKEIFTLEKSKFSKFSTLISLSPNLSVVPALLDDATKYRLSIEIFLLCKTSIIFLPTFPVAPTIAIFMMINLY